MQDEEILQLIKSSPDKGLNNLMDKYAGLIYYIVRSKLGNLGTSEDIEECVSDVFIDFYNSVEQIDIQKGSIKAYLSVIAKRKGIDIYRRLIKKASILSIDDNADLIYKDENTDIEQGYVNSQEKISLVKNIHSLGEPDTEIFIRKFYIGQSTKEIARAINIKENTIDKRISRGLKKLKTIMGGNINGEGDSMFAG